MLCVLKIYIKDIYTHIFLQLPFQYLYCQSLLLLIYVVLLHSFLLMNAVPLPVLYHSLSIPLPVDIKHVVTCYRYYVCWQFSVIINNATLDILYMFPWAHSKISVGYVSKRGIVTTWDMWIFNFSRYAGTSWEWLYKFTFL